MAAEVETMAYRYLDEREYEMQQKAKNKAFELIAKNIEGWWD